jgi:glycogen synthase
VIGFNGDNSKTATGLGFETTMMMAVSSMLARSPKSSSITQRLSSHVVANAMALDHSWVKASQEYLKVYQSLLK